MSQKLCLEARQWATLTKDERAALPVEERQRIKAAILVNNEANAARNLARIARREEELAHLPDRIAETLAIVKRDYAEYRHIREST